MKHQGTTVGIVGLDGEFEVVVSSNCSGSGTLTYVESSCADLAAVLKKVGPRNVCVVVDRASAIRLAASAAAIGLPVSIVHESQLDKSVSPRAAAAARLAKIIPPRPFDQQVAARINRSTSISLADAAEGFGVARWPDCCAEKG